MAFGASSSVFREWNIQMLQVSGTGYTGLDSDTVKVSLHNNSITPDKDAAVASTGFNTGTWTTTNEVTDATNWVSGGRALASKTFTTPATGVCMFDAADLAGGGNVTISNAYGCLVYDDTITAGTVADQGVCFNSFGGAASVTAGTFTIVWSASGIARWSSS
ncbi:hypothetical protein ACQP2Y_21580 [Actinoplanes sp. CA-051413]|uniref:hypothetical protein n=1 Tax=Actinoplanes sp. CA-051413 TaxID=3239899 RepID=UPI003D99391E